ncbi:MAG: hypothetical protein AWU58_567 [Methanohalophilus sp. T328-1]|jgi:hypothetical protein|nr:MAG: hypothetical protein AWU58_567 [Methanohalophilus sp. T328-1]
MNKNANPKIIGPSTKISFGEYAHVEYRAYDASNDATNIPIVLLIDCKSNLFEFRICTYELLA